MLHQVLALAKKTIQRITESNLHLNAKKVHFQIRKVDIGIKKLNQGCIIKESFDFFDPCKALVMFNDTSISASVLNMVADRLSRFEYQF